MKGPGLRIDLDVRRVWRCSKCGRIVRTLGQVTAQRCGCTEAAQWMQLQPAVKKEPFRAPAREHLLEEWEVAELAVAPAGQPEVAEAPAALEQPGESPPQTLGQPASDPAPAAMAENPAAESGLVDESATKDPAPAPDPAIPPPDAFGTGVEDTSRNRDEP